MTISLTTLLKKSITDIRQEPFLVVPSMILFFILRFIEAKYVTPLLVAGEPTSDAAVIVFFVLFFYLFFVTWLYQFLNRFLRLRHVDISGTFLSSFPKWLRLSSTIILILLPLFALTLLISLLSTWVVAIPILGNLFVATMFFLLILVALFFMEFLPLFSVVSEYSPLGSISQAIIFFRKYPQQVISVLAVMTTLLLMSSFIGIILSSIPIIGAAVLLPMFQGILMSLSTLFLLYFYWTISEDSPSISTRA